VSTEVLELCATPAVEVEAEVRRTLAADGLVAFPTESYYGIAASPWSVPANERLRRLKGGRADKPLPLVLASTAACLRVAATLPAGFHALSATLWPGPLTLLLPAAADLAWPLLAGGVTIGVRVSPHPVATMVARACDGAATATSANRSGEEPARSAAEIVAAIGDDLLDLVVDGGQTAGGLPSTIVDLTVSPPRLVRAGAVAIERISDCLGLPPALVVGGQG